MPARRRAELRTAYEPTSDPVERARHLLVRSHLELCGEGSRQLPRSRQLGGTGAGKPASALKEAERPGQIGFE